MTRVYEVDPGNVANIWETDAVGRRYETGGPGPWLTRTGNRPSSIPAAGLPEWDVYPATEDNSTCGPYTTRSRTLTFSGAVHSSAARVVESVVCTQIQIDDLRDRKYAELNAYVEEILNNTAETSLHPNWAIVIDSPARIWHGSVSEFLQDRMRDRVYDADPKDYWPRDVPVPVVNTNNDRREAPTVTESQWGQIKKDIGIHDLSATDARELVIADIESAHGANDWNALAAIDVTEPAYGWPPSYPLPGG